ncbi:pentapeptide repeat-containing protein [Aerosakkonemataceae cyanobacterium BLCC-F154]|uniref:Pentapeptide repeat-containing protein n=1 Tax=Floridaenema fluviatile BLCC-F154 TaxID=3153640 RepID=A0ABV4Y7R3_9CYAN
MIYREMNDSECQRLQILLDKLKNSSTNEEANVDPFFLVNCDLRGFDLKGANLTGLYLSSVNLSGADLSNAILKDVKLWGADLSNANLVEACLDGASLCGGVFIDSAGIFPLSGANLSGANLSNASLWGANLSEANLSQAQLKNSYLCGAYLVDANLSSANFSGADLTEAKLNGADLSGADLSKSNLLGTNLSRANLNNANLEETENLDHANLNNATYNDATKLPKDFSPQEVAMTAAPTVINFNSDLSYERLCKKIDEYLIEAIENYCQSIKINSKCIKIDDETQVIDELIIEGINELSKLRKGKDPDYDMWGIPVVYAFKYLPRKITAVIAVLSHYFQIGGAIPRRVLDIGSGTDAVSIALYFYIQKSLIEVIAFEPSKAMRTFANNFSSKKGSYVFTKRFERSVDDLIDRYEKGQIKKGSFDLVMMSSVLQNRFKNKEEEWWTTFIKALNEVTTKNANLILIEPKMKEEMLNKMRESLTDCGWVSLCEKDEFLKLRNMLPNVENKNHELTRMTEWLGQLNGRIFHRYDDLLSDRSDELESKFTKDGLWLFGTGNNPYPVTTWNDKKDYDEYILIFRKQQ